MTISPGAEQLAPVRQIKRYRRFLYAFGLSVLPLAALVAYAFAVVTRSPANVPRASPAAELESLPVIFDPNPVELGELRPTQVGRGVASLSNPSDRLHEAAIISTSCPCLRVSHASIRVEPHSTATMDVTFDPSEEPDFRGALSIEVTGTDPNGTLVFRGKVNVQVQNPPDDSPKASPRLSDAPPPVEAERSR